ncbi:MAG: MBL fold metallo-hydrolase [Bacteroidetes bacterium]|nr:MBL fold metallo-hydrolase [Bacteroidota bacterium]
MRKLLFLIGLTITVTTQAQDVTKLKITILSTMVADLKGTGEWGFSALVEADTSRILFDVGGRPNTVRDNAKELNVNLQGIRQVVLSHNHIDHTAGLSTLQKQFPDGATASLLYTGPNFFLRTAIPVGILKADSATYAAAGSQFITIDHPQKIAPGIYLTGPVPRQYPEKNYPPGKTLTISGTTIEDNVPEDISMVIRTNKGLVVLTGCGHAGVVNTLEYVSKQFPGEKIVALIGGIHLLDAKTEQFDWTANKLKALNIQYFIGAHCTGLNSVYRIREVTGMTKENCLVGTVGMTFDIDLGIKTGWLK